MISREICQRVLSKAVSTGADYAEVFCENTVNQSINMIGNQAICLECTARPIGIKDLNTSMLCIGTRHRAGWKDDEMAVGIPGEQFIDVVNGLMNTLNQMENDSNKKIIEVAHLVSEIIPIKK